MGIHRIRRLSHQPSVVHVTSHANRLWWTCWILGKFLESKVVQNFTNSSSLAERARQLLDPHQLAQSSPTRHFHPQDSSSRCKSFDCSLQLRVMPQLLLRVRRVALVLCHDSVLAQLSFCRRWILPNGHVGARKAPQLQERVQRLPKETQSNHSIPSLSLFSVVNRHQRFSFYFNLFYQWRLFLS